MDEDPASTDMAPFALGAHDVRVERAGWVYYVRAVRRTESLAGRGLDPNGGLIGLAVLVVVEAISGRLRRRVAWKVGVVRLPSARSWNVGRPRVVHRELLAVGEEPGSRIAVLAAEARAGTYHPTKP